MAGESESSPEDEEHGKHVSINTSDDTDAQIPQWYVRVSTQAATHMLSSYATLFSSFPCDTVDHPVTLSKHRFSSSSSKNSWLVGDLALILRETK